MQAVLEPDAKVEIVPIPAFRSKDIPLETLPLYPVPGTPYRRLL